MGGGGTACSISINTRALPVQGLLAHVKRRRGLVQILAITSMEPATHLKNFISERQLIPAIQNMAEDVVMVSQLNDEEAAMKRHVGRLAQYQEHLK